MLSGTSSTACSRIIEGRAVKRGRASGGQQQAKKLEQLSIGIEIARQVRYVHSEELAVLTDDGLIIAIPRGGKRSQK